MASQPEQIHRSPVIQETCALLSERTGSSVADLTAAAAIAYHRTALEPRRLASRMKWLLDPFSVANPTEGVPVANQPVPTANISLLNLHPEATIAQIAEWIANPAVEVLGFIESHSTVSKADLDEIYRTMRYSSSDPYGLPDLTVERILQEMKWWIVDLAFPAYYFDATPPDEIAHQILVNRFHEIQGTDSESYRSMKVSYVSPSGTKISWVHSAERFMEVEQEIEAEYYQLGHAFDVSVYAHQDLYLYISSHSEVPIDATEFERCVPKSFLHRDYEERRERYRAVWAEVRRTESFHVDFSRKESTGEYRLMIGFPAMVINHFMANLSRALLRSGITARRKYVVVCGGAVPMMISSFYSERPFPADFLAQVVDIGLYPSGELADLTEANTITPAETNFAHAAIGFVHAFITAADPNVDYLEDRFRDNVALRELFTNVRRNIARDTFPLDRIVAALRDHPEILKEAFAIFARKFNVDRHPAEGPDTAGPNRVMRRFDEAARHCDELSDRLTALLPTQEKIDIFRMVLEFVRSTIRTTFFLPVKTAIAFRLEPSFLNARDYERTPFAIIYVKGRNFGGFHIRFGEIARGGIRIIRSRTIDEYRSNANTLFDECYNLAVTQDRKNKDIPEKGAKGVILPDFGYDDRPGREDCFHRYVDALLDLILPENAGRISNYAEELLFLGPDENSAELMDWACIRCRDRGYRSWKAFTTGKDVALGGISHIDYGMTTNSVHRYVLGVLRELKIDEASITKIQTGGPDGDLGGNEILLSRDRTIGVIDGGGVLYDPDGLNRDELVRLARARIDSSSFNVALLGRNGFLVRVSDKDAVLPDGTRVASGLTFRNTFHLSGWMRADLFVPCGGRPQSVNAANWQKLLTDTGVPRFRWIVEGANLFFSPEARLKLEESGVTIFKDASTNKGGVTSSSYEVLAGLALSDETFMHTMGRTSGERSFRDGYIKEIIERIRDNADKEFAILWKLHHRDGTPLSELSDLLSNRILEVTAGIEQSGLFDDPRLVRNVLYAYVPKILAETLGFDTVLETVPRPYLRAAFARSVAARFVYRYGIDAGYEDYRLFIQELRAFK